MSCVVWMLKLVIAYVMYKLNYIYRLYGFQICSWYLHLFEIQINILYNSRSWIIFGWFLVVLFLNIVIEWKDNVHEKIFDYLVSELNHSAPPKISSPSWNLAFMCFFSMTILFVILFLFLFHNGRSYRETIWNYKYKIVYSSYDSCCNIHILDWLSLLSSRTKDEVLKKTLCQGVMQLRMPTTCLCWKGTLVLWSRHDVV